MQQPNADDKLAAASANEKGFALIVVLWLGILLALMAAGFSSAVRSRLRATGAEADLVRAGAYADAGARIALIGLLNGNGQSTTRSTQERSSQETLPLVCSIDAEASLMITIEDEEGKVPLNGASEELLVALFSGLGASGSDARHFAQLIIDFRDADDESRTDGAERDDYLKAAKVTGPKNAPFASVDELDQVLGIPPTLREKAKPFFSAVSDGIGIDEGLASPELKDVLVRGSGGISIPPASGDASDSLTIASALPPAFRIVSSRTHYRVISEAVLTSGSRYASDVIVRLPGGALSEPVYERWRRGISVWPQGAPVPPAKQLKPC